MCDVRSFFVLGYPGCIRYFITYAVAPEGFSAPALRFLTLTSVPRSPTMFYIIGLGLCDEKDITVRGLEVSVQTSYPFPIFDR